MKVADVKEGTVSEFVSNKFKTTTMSHVIVKGADLCTQSVKQNMFWFLNPLSLRRWWDCRSLIEFLIGLHEDRNVLLRVSAHLVICEFDMILARSRVEPYDSAIKVL